MIIFLLSGLWHGANLTYVCWGFYHGLLLVIAILIGCNTKYKEVVASSSILPAFKDIIHIVLVFLFVVYGWIIFRADSLSQFVGFTSRMLSQGLFTKPNIWGMNMNSKLMMIAVLLFVEWIMRNKEHGLDLSCCKYALLRYSIYTFLLFLIFVYGGNAVNFIYFQF